MEEHAKPRINHAPAFFPPKQQGGFSLVELSIVLVILGLLVGGILAGQSLIRAAELRAVSTELTRYVTSMHAFRDKYFGLPGDLRNATSFWGAADGNDGLGLDCYETDSTGLATTCNGNGDGVLDYATAYGNEPFRFWQHLANAGLIEGSYSGVAAVTGASRVVSLGVNTPRSKFPNVGYTIFYVGQQTSSGWAYDGNYGNAFQFGAPESPADIYEGLALKPEEMWNIDVKIDDGKPAFGTFRSYTNSQCSTSTTAASAEYAVSLSALGCRGMFMTGY